MNVSECVRVAQAASRSYRQVVCEFCGAETLTGGGVVFCSSCESIVGSEAKELESTNPNLFSSLSSIRTSLQKGDYEGASAIYDQLMKDRQSAQLLYAKGIMYIEYSNQAVSQIRYDGEGFMERNAELRVKGSLLISEAKRLIAKSLSISEKESKEAPNVYTFYRMFLCELKMRNLRAASDYVNKMAELDKVGVVSSYSKIVLHTYAESYKEAEKEIEKVVRMKSPPANVFYYASFAAFKMGDYRGVERLVKACGGLIEEEKKANMLNVLKDVESLQE